MYIEDIAKDFEGFERVLKVIQGLWDGRVKLIQNPNDNCLSCQIGDYWFYFLGMEDENLTPDEVRLEYDIFMLADLIVNTISDLDDDNEYDYYCNILDF